MAYQRPDVYPNGSPIPKSLPASYRPASYEGVPAGQSCFTCSNFNFATRYCKAWKAPVKPKWWCEGWATTSEGLKNKMSEKQEWFYTIDVIRIDVPTMIRLLEFAREEAKTDVKLHEIAEELAEHSKNDLITMKYYYDIIDMEEPNSVMSEEAMLFRMNSRTLWSRFAWSLLNYSIALNSEISGVEQAEARIYTHAEKLGNYIVPYYNDSIGRALGDGLTAFGRIGVAVMKDLKAGIDLDGTMAKWNQINEDIATLLSGINPEYWPKEVVKKYFDTLVKYWVDSITARRDQDWVSNDIAIDNIDKLMTTGDGEMTSLADVFSNGIISQHPKKFVD